MPRSGRSTSQLIVDGDEPSEHEVGKVAGAVDAGGRVHGRRRSAVAPQDQTKGRRSKRRASGPSAAALSLVSADGETLHESPPEVNDAIRFMLARQTLRHDTGWPGIVGVMASLSGEGTTFVSRSLALVLANDYDRRVCLVEANWTGVPPDGPAGLADVVQGRAALASATIHTTTPQLDVLPSGSATERERAMIVRHPSMETTLNQIAHHYDHVIIDLPPARASSDGLALAALCDGIAVVVRQGATPENQIAEVIAELNERQVLGVILNSYTSRTPRSVLRRIPLW